MSGILSILLIAAAATPTAARCPTDACDPSILARRSLTAAMLSGPAPVIDGRLDEAAWAAAPVATDFVESSPRPAARASLRSEARVLADGEALFVGLRYFDPAPEGIQAPLVRRDDEITSDWAFVEFDSRHDRRSGFSFGVNPRGVQADGSWLGDSLADYDTSWNGVYQAAAHVDAEGWTAELRIPFSQLPFSLPGDAQELVWGVNFYRFSPSHGETSNWSPRFEGLGGVLSYFNELHVPAPRGVNRFEVAPYVAPRLGQETSDADGAAVKAGADLKVGLGSDFALAATLLPDFGQVEADPSQVNLTAFETFQAERRPFFLEGLDVFRFDTHLGFATRGVSFGDEAPFYSRRVGQAPEAVAPDGTTLEGAPTSTTLLGAAKLVGQTHGWTLGAFSAATGGAAAMLDVPGQASRSWSVEAPATLSVARAIRTLAGGRSTIGLFLADRHRFDPAPEVAAVAVRDAASAGLDVRHRFAGGRYETRGWVLGSRVSGTPAAITRLAESAPHFFQRPDAPRLHRRPYGDHLDGFAGEAHLAKVGGAFRWDLAGRAVSPGFDVGQIGFQRASDWLLVAGTWRYERFSPGRAVRHWIVGSDSLGLGWSWGGETRARVADAYLALDTRDYWNLRLAATREASALSTEWLRGGPALRLPPRTRLALSLLTDQRRPSYASLDLGAASEPASGSWSVNADPGLTVRSSDRLRWSVTASWQRDVVGWQPVGTLDTGDATTDVVGRDRQTTLSLTLRADWTFSPRLVLQGFVRPFATTGRYDRFQRLAAPRDPVAGARFVPVAVASGADGGSLGVDLDADGAFESSLAAPDLAERSLDGSLILRWEYRPGSFLTVVWNHQRRGASRDVSGSSLDRLGGLLSESATNVVFAKLSLRLGR